MIMFSLFTSVFRGLLRNIAWFVWRLAASRAQERQSTTPFPQQHSITLTVRVDSSDSSCGASLAGLSPDLKLSVMSFLYNDFGSLQALMSSCKAFKLDQGTVKTSIRNDLLQLHQDDHGLLCSICSKPVTYPYKLADCSHVACGRCAWFQSPNGRCGGCSTKIRSTPRHLGPEENRLADIRAFWMLSEKENARRRQQHDKRVHRGTAGFFGKNGKQNKLNPFDGKGFPAEFDDMPVLHVDELHLLPKFCPLWITVCPASQNYSGFPEVSGTASRFDAPSTV